METPIYKGQELTEITTTQLFNPPRKMLVWDYGTVVYERVVQAILTDDKGNIAVCTQSPTGGWILWKHCAEIPESTTPRRATRRELAKWLAQGKGEWTYRTDVCSPHNARTYYEYNFDTAEHQVRIDALVRKWDDTEWHEPTIDYMEIE